MNSTPFLLYSFPKGILLFSTIAIISFSCQNNTEQHNASIKADFLTISDGGIKTIRLENGLNFESLMGIKWSLVNLRPTISFYDAITHAFYFYDANTNELYNKILLEKEGPNAVHLLTQFRIHSSDSIILDSSSGLLTLNGEGEIVQKKFNGKKSKGGAIVLNFDEPRAILDLDSELKNGKIEASLLLMERTEEDFERVFFDIERGNLSQHYLKTNLLIPNYEVVIETKKEAKKRRQFAQNIKRNFKWKGGFLYASTSISDSVYVFKEGQHTKTIYAGYSPISVASYSDYAKEILIEHFEGGMNYHQNPKQAPYFKDMIISPDKKFIYRVFFHGTKPKFISGVEEVIPEPLGATLIVLNTTNDKLSYFKLPEHEIEFLGHLYQAFTSDAGIYFRVKDQTNEDQVEFRLFKVEEN